MAGTVCRSLLKRATAIRRSPDLQPSARNRRRFMTPPSTRTRATSRPSDGNIQTGRSNRGLPSALQDRAERRPLAARGCIDLSRRPSGHRWGEAWRSVSSSAWPSMGSSRSTCSHPHSPPEARLRVLPQALCSGPHTSSTRSPSCALRKLDGNRTGDVRRERGAGVPQHDLVAGCALGAAPSAALAGAVIGDRRARQVARRRVRRRARPHRERAALAREPRYAILREQPGDHRGRGRERQDRARELGSASRSRSPRRGRASRTRRSCCRRRRRRTPR